MVSTNEVKNQTNKTGNLLRKITAGFPENERQRLDWSCDNKQGSSQSPFVTEQKLG